MTDADEAHPDQSAGHHETDQVDKAIEEAELAEVARTVEAARKVGTLGRTGQDTWRLVSVVDVSMDLPATNPEVVLQESVAPWRALRIPVGLAEGNAIAFALRQVATPRPLTHTLLAELLERHGVEVEAARITTRTRQSFAAELDTSGPKGRQVVPCRPSDAIALILRQRLPTPLLVADWVFDNVAHTGPDDTGPDDTGPDDTGPDHTGPDHTGPNGGGPDHTGPGGD
ncbi:MAG TPA: bifunctional nuclease family protein [Acidimicrobiales bacterium]|nr:bifunctional nuclease family protein [Acidimicrobiales bacterium]